MRAAASPARRDPAVALWAAAGTCWALTAALVLAGGPGPCQEGGADATSEPPPATTVAAWLVMTGAMTLPTIIPLARMYARVTAPTARPAAARLALVAGYLAVWSVFATVAMLAHRAADVLLDDVPRPGPVLGSVLVAAGFFQFSALKRTCLTTCRSPWAFLWRHYARGVGGGWTLGLRHGLLCLGCCWALMLVMVATGIGSLLWMLALAGAMAVEKAARWGAQLVAPLGAALVLAGVAVLAIRATGTGAPGEVGLLVATIALVGAGTAVICRRRRRRNRVPATGLDHDPMQRAGARARRRARSLT
jgi:predicted metal-binding membrane protein